MVDFVKRDLKDLTILIPVRIDSLARLENILAVIKYIDKYFDTNVFVLEADARNCGILNRQILCGVQYSYVKDCDPVFYRTKYINLMASKVATEYLAVWDADVILPPSQVYDSVQKLRSKQFDFCYPYDGTFLDTSKLIRGLFLDSNDVAWLEELRDFMLAPYGLGVRGGAFLANTMQYRKVGMENLNFYGWGPEDWERYERWMNLGARIGYSKGCLYHLSHPRDLNGMHNSSQQKMCSYYEKDLIMNSSKKEIVRHLNLFL